MTQGAPTRRARWGCKSACTLAVVVCVVVLVRELATEYNVEPTLEELSAPTFARPHTAQTVRQPQPEAPATHHTSLLPAPAASRPPSTNAAPARSSKSTTRASRVTGTLPKTFWNGRKALGQRNSSREWTGVRTVIGVLADHESIQQLGVTAHGAWFGPVSRIADVFFFIGECDFPPALVNATICLNTPDVYPPQLKEFLLWEYMHDHFLNHYDFFIKADLDTYMEAYHLNKLLMSYASKVHQPMYIGRAASGRKGEDLGLEVDYCLGLGYVLTAPAVKNMYPSLARCNDETVSNHSDTEVGRCIYQTSKIACTDAEYGSFMHIYHQVFRGKVVSRSLSHGGQQMSRFLSRPPHPYFLAAFLHPIKSAEEMNLFHYQSINYLRPILPPIATPHDSESVLHKNLHRSFMNSVRQSCVHNTVYQLQATNLVLPECTSPARKSKPLFPLRASLLHLSSTPFKPPTINNLSQIISFDSVPVNAEHFHKAPQREFLSTIKSVFTEAIRQSRPYLMLLTEDVLLHCEFALRFPELINDSRRCAHHLFAHRAAGVLALGGREWTAKDWQPIIVDNRRSRSKTAKTRTQCYNIGKDTLASFAVVFSPYVYSEVVDWLDFTNGTEPFHHVLQYLTDIGRIVRVAFPYLAIQNPSHAPVFEGQDLEQLYRINTAAQRAETHVWTPDNYCIPMRS
eukprot:m.205794 g.205794  ORF g.205794 m.205794 type:complete len:684 (-) comp53879_c0_seq2:203-2254(-)